MMLLEPQLEFFSNKAGNRRHCHVNNHADDIERGKTKNCSPGAWYTTMSTAEDAERNQSEPDKDGFVFHFGFLHFQNVENMDFHIARHSIPCNVTRHTMCVKMRAQS